MKKDYTLALHINFTENMNIDNLPFIISSFDDKVDYYISTNSIDNKDKINKYLKNKKIKNNYYIQYYDDNYSLSNCIKQLKCVINNYDYIGNLYEFDNTFLNNIQLISAEFITLPSLGIVSTFSDKRYSLDNELYLNLKTNLKIDNIFSNNFVLNNNFIARVDAVKPLFNLENLTKGSDDTIKKVLADLVLDRGYSYKVLYNNMILKTETLNLIDYNAERADYRVFLTNLLQEMKALENNYKNLNDMYNEAKKLETELHNIVNSKSWKVTKPLRWVMKKVSKPPIVVKNNDSEEKQEDIKVTTIKNSTNIIYQDNMDFSKFKTDIKTIAFYLPQFHCFKENDEWWGKGFTEWTNTKKAKPRFEGHYQPRTPHKDIGYYKLDNIATINKQIKLAKQHGIYGFCFYYYWFSGKRLMEKPLNLFLEHKEINFPFCLCWANENWTRRWDGLDKEVLIGQKYKKEDAKRFVKDIKKYLLDQRYIKIDNKPLLLIYKPEDIPNFLNMIDDFRKYAKEEGIGELYIMIKSPSFSTNFNYIEKVDGEFDFPPHYTESNIENIKTPSTTDAYDYAKIVKKYDDLYRKHFPIKDFYYTTTMNWDNSSRRKENYLIYCNYSINYFYEWLRNIIRETRKRNKEDKRFIFVNAWNEWAEGTYLEPDEKCGYANINTLSKAIFDLEFEWKDDKIK